MQLRYLQTLNGIATEQNSTIVFPLPIDIFSFFQKCTLDPNAFLPIPTTTSLRPANHHSVTVTETLVPSQAATSI